MNFLTTTALVFQGPMVLAPAMHGNMWRHGAVEENVQTLIRRGVAFVGPVHGPLASGEMGVGRMSDPAEIVQAVLAAGGAQDLKGLTVLVNAGPTREAWDPVRYLGNRSSGKMGFALAAAAARRGAAVRLVAGPVDLPTPPGVERRDVESAEEMKVAMVAGVEGADLVFLAAAVADFRPRQVAETKMKRQDGLPVLELERTSDVLLAVKEAARGALLVGFAAETEKMQEHAEKKLLDKGVDAVVANDVSRQDIGFGSDHNEVMVMIKDREPIVIPRRPKSAVADALLDLFSETLRAR
jgi:phosphopantothenoylcysteine decarboxylase/phosphopantothenate--cysteine ligase